MNRTVKAKALGTLIASGAFIGAYAVLLVAIAVEGSPVLAAVLLVAAIAFLPWRKARSK